MKTKAVVFDEPLKVSLREYELPEITDDQILVKTLITGISTGTEIRVFRGKQKGSQFPLVPGYETIGEVVEVGKNQDIAVGTKVFVLWNSYTGPYSNCWGGQVQYSVTDVKNIVKLPDDLSDEQLMKLSFVRLGAIAHHGVSRGSVAEGDHVAVIGQGIIGHLAMQISRARGADVTSVDIDDKRLEVSRKGGADNIINSKTKDLKKEIYDYCGGVDVVVDATGIAELANTNIQIIKPRSNSKFPPFEPNSRYVLLGSPMESQVCFDYQNALFRNEVNIYVSRSFTMVDLESSKNLILEGKVNPMVIGPKLFDVTRAEEAFDLLNNGKEMRILFDWRNI